MKSAIIIGAGFGGLALAIRLQSAGVQTTIVEARDKPGGRGYYWERQGFTFDAGPTVVTDPPCLRELWELSGSDMADDVDLISVMPFYRLNWPDGTNFDYSNDQAALNAEIAKLNPADVTGYARFLEYSKGVYEEESVFADASVSNLMLARLPFIFLGGAKYICVLTLPPASQLDDQTMSSVSGTLSEKLGWYTSSRLPLPIH